MDYNNSNNKVNNKETKVKAQIDRYINGQLSEEEAEDLWIELIQHEAYMDYLKTASNLKDLVQQEKATPEKLYIWRYAAAAAVFILVVVFSILQWGSFNRAENVKPIDKIALDYYRSAEPVAKMDANKRVIRKAIELFNNGKFQMAVKLLNDERDKASDLSWISELDITLGTLYYNKDHFNEAAYYFKDVVKHKNQIKDLTLEKAYWYLGNSYFQMNMHKEATTTMKKAYKLDGAYSRVAKSYLDAMAEANSK